MQNRMELISEITCPAIFHNNSTCYNCKRKRKKRKREKRKKSRGKREHIQKRSSYNLSALWYLNTIRRHGLEE